MSPNPVRCFLALIAAVGISMPIPGKAGDYADHAVLGFSPDGQYFAFEEYGIQDGSGFPYSNIFLIDTAIDQWVAGTPIRVLTEGESPSLSKTRSEGADRFRPFLIEYQIRAPGNVVAANPLTETSANPHFVSFTPQLFSSPRDRGYELALQDIQLAAPDCPDVGQPYHGFQLTMIDPARQQQILSRDEHIPGSRNCPLAYAISEVLVYHPPNRQAVFVVLISVLSVGFEGPNRRFIAVTGQL